MWLPEFMLEALFMRSEELSPVSLADSMVARVYVVNHAHEDWRDEPVSPAGYRVARVYVGPIGYRAGLL